MERRIIMIYSEGAFFEEDCNKTDLKVVVIGGGTGLSVLLRGLKKRTCNLTAVVTVADDGGGTGVLRRDLGMPPPGDLRNCLLALAETEPLINELLEYRFTDGKLKGQSFGNLFLAAMHGISESFDEAVRKMGEVLRVSGRVLPVTTQNINLAATLENGTVVFGESKIPKMVKELESGVRGVKLIADEDIKALPDVVEAIKEADLIVMGPGSLYTSIIPNLLVDDVTKSILEAKAFTVYVCNVMTQPYETINYTAYDHYRAIIDHSSEGIIDCCVVNSKLVSSELRERYMEEHSELVVLDREFFEIEKIPVIEGDLVTIHNGLIRHNNDRLAGILINIGLEHQKKQNALGKKSC